MVNKLNVLLIVKSRLNRRDDTLDDYLLTRIDAAAEELAGIGIHLSDTASDMVFIADYVAWQYGNRDKNTGMPEWLRLARRERWLAKDRSIT